MERHRQRTDNRWNKISLFSNNTKIVIEKVGTLTVSVVLKGIPLDVIVFQMK